LSLFEAVILGIIQGLSEFLPISSTGHLTVAGKLLGLISEENPEEWTAFIAIIQLGTLAAILIYFWRDIYQIVTSFFKENFYERKGYKSQSTDSKLGWLIIIGTIPIGVVGLLFKDIIEGTLTKNLYVIAGSLILLALILAVAEKTAKFNKEVENLTIKDTLIIGLAQAFALIPGSSRAGTTITGGLFVGLKRASAARFSFLLSMPAIFLSGVLQVYEAWFMVEQSMVINIIVSSIISGISGYIAIDFLLKFLRKYTTFTFIYYRIALGIIILILISFNFIQP
jgi:undecaprenyl-diphosphatase